MNNMIIYIVKYTSIDIMYMEDKHCAEFYTKYVDSSYKISELNITYDTYENSHMIITIKEFIDKIERDYIRYYKNPDMHKDIFIIKSKLREQIINKLLDE